MTRTAVIIVTYNAKPYLQACLESLRNQNDKEFKIFVVDNNSQDETCQIIRKNYPEVYLIINKENLGFAKANNIGLKKAESEGASNFVLLNQDTVVLNNCIEVGRKVLEEKKIGLASPRILYKENNKIWWVGSKVYRGKELFFRSQFTVAEHLYKKEKINGRFEKIADSDYLPGTALFIKGEVLRKVGFLSEDFFMYGEDLDYSLRVKKAGYRLVYFPDTTVYHDTPFSSIKKKTVVEFLKKQKNYFQGVGKIVFKHFTFFEKLFWTLKLPLTLIVSGIRGLIF